MASNGSIPASGVGSLFTLIKRLEAATSRLEDIAVHQSGPSSPRQQVSPSLSSSLGSAHTAHTAAAAPTSSSTAATAEEGVSPSVAAFDQLLSGPLNRFVSAAAKAGPIASEQAAAVEEAFKAQRSFLVMAGQCRKPTSGESMVLLLKPTEGPLARTIKVKDGNRGEKKIFNGLNTVAEGIPALAWVTLDSKPGPLVAESKDSAQFWANRVLKEFKDTEPDLVEWTRTFILLLDELRKYILQFHTTCLGWNPKGEDPMTFAANASSASSTSAPPPPPPPPGPPPPPAAPPAPTSSTAATSSSGGGMDAVFASINQGEGITSGLKKVDKSERTHKNPSLRAAAGTGASTSPNPSRPTKPPKPQSFQKKPSKLQLDGNKWAVEYFENDSNVVVAETELSQIVNVFGCKNSTVQIKGKVNAITLVSCVKTSVLVDSAVSSLSITSSPSFTVQVLGKVPTIMIDATDGGQIYLSKEGEEGVEIVTSKTSAINVSLPVKGEEDGVFAEKAVPEQLKTVVSAGKLVTTVLEHSA